MNLEIKPLTPELAADYFDFFDNRAFPDRKGAFCYCTWFHFDCSVSIKEHYEQGRDAMRAQAAAYIANGILNGYLAFADGISIGWCNTDDKTNYLRLKTDPFICGDVHQRIKSVVCFEIAPEYRGKGVAAALLERIVADAQIQDYTAVEGYPKLHAKHEPFDYAGPIRLYEKLGFINAAQQDNTIIMRKITG